ncbi:DUF423 domain-containing protein [Thaumasiovibrio subtropicus]|uniref:DUF423 domain-containing protein n=1 Tax=Thaumasiovibrio subtropicus TaxID=1891207 RepID=UPI000B359B5F|nr:DUF423 domain-containing protein [Thaumasiovibrio subtropicus]
MAKWILVLASLSGALSVMLGAFAAHGLKAKLPPHLLDVFQTGVQYQFIHTLVLLVVGIWMRFLPTSGLSYAALFFALGIVMFSGSLYALALTGIKWFGPITPLGGLCFIIGWVALAVAAWRLA